MPKFYVYRVPNGVGKLWAKKQRNKARARHQAALVNGEESYLTSHLLKAFDKVPPVLKSWKTWQIDSRGKYHSQTFATYEYGGAVLAVEDNLAAISICSMADKFDFEVGAEIAENRLIAGMPESFSFELLNRYPSILDTLSSLNSTAESNSYTSEFEQLLNLVEELQTYPSGVFNQLQMM